jgi:peptidoglycan L-alanyl-D-glutamate endopeptidase CwlK
MGKYKWGKASAAHRAQLHPDLQKLADYVLEHWGGDVTISDGARSVAEQRKNILKGVSKTMDSMHLPRDANGVRDDGPDGRAWAMDICPYPTDWKAITRGLNAMKAADPGMQTAEFYMFLGFIAGAAEVMGIPVRLGADWDSDRDFADHTFIDLPHVERKKEDA